MFSLRMDWLESVQAKIGATDPLERFMIDDASVTSPSAPGESIKVSRPVSGLIEETRTLEAETKPLWSEM